MKCRGCDNSDLVRIGYRFVPKKFYALYCPKCERMWMR